MFGDAFDQVAIWIAFLQHIAHYIQTQQPQKTRRMGGVLQNWQETRTLRHVQWKNLWHKHCQVLLYRWLYTTYPSRTSVTPCLCHRGHWPTMSLVVACAFADTFDILLRCIVKAAPYVLHKLGLCYSDAAPVSSTKSALQISAKDSPIFKKQKSKAFVIYVGALG